MAAPPWGTRLDDANCATSHLDAQVLLAYVLQVDRSWLFAHHANPLLVSHDMELYRVSLVSISMVAVALGALLVSWKRGKLREARRFWIPLAIIPFAILFLQFRLLSITSGAG